MIPTHEGRYIARPIDWTVEESGENKIPTFVCSFDLVQFLDRDGWQDVSDLQITGYFYLFKKDGSINEIQVKSLRDALGWDGRSVVGLANGLWKQVEVQLSLANDTYENKTRMKVRYINPRDYAPGHIEKNPDAIKSIASKYDMQLRALAGNTPAKPSAPSNNAAMNGALVQAARKAAWEAFQKKNPDKTTAYLAELWRSEIKSVFPDKVSTTFTAEDWKAVQAAIERPPEMAMAGASDPPFGDEETFDPDSIPF